MIGPASQVLTMLSNISVVFWVFIYVTAIENQKKRTLLFCVVINFHAILCTSKLKTPLVMAKVSLFVH